MPVDKIKDAIKGSKHVRLTKAAAKIFSNKPLGDKIIAAISGNMKKLNNSESIQVENIIIKSATNDNS